MKKLIAIALFMVAIAVNGIAQETQFDFSAVCETGQTLYYRITDEEVHTVILTHPRSDSDPWFQGDYYEYYVAPQGEIILSSVVVNNDINYTITAIDANTFWGCNITSIFIPNTVNTITPRAFGSCELLESISMEEGNPTYYSESNAIIRREDNALVVGCKTSTIPDGIEIICQEAFYAMGNSGVLLIPNSVRIIEDGAFAYNSFAGSLALPESLETLGSMAFYVSGFSGSLTIPNSVTEIGHHAFFGCSFSGSLTLSSSLSTIKNCAFANCHFSGTLVIPNSVNLIVSAAFAENDFSELVLGESVATIGSSAFIGCNHLTGALRLPASLTQINQLAFKNTSFDEIYSPNTIPPTLDFTDLYSFAFEGYDTNTPIHIPFGCTEAYQNAEGWNYFTNFIETETNLEGEWYYEIKNDNGSITYQHLQHTGDTVMMGKRPKIIVRSNTHYDKEAHTEVTHEYIYEENGKVYWWNKTLQEFTTLYDLTAEVGDEWEIKVGNESLIMHVDAEGRIDYEGRSYRTIHVRDENDLFSGDIVCGIGHLTSFFPERLMFQGKGYRVDGLRCYWVNGSLNFRYGNRDCDEVYEQLHHGLNETSENGFAVYPNPTRGTLFVETQNIATLTNPTYRITNLMGQTLMQGIIHTETQQIDISNLPTGMYFFSVSEQTVKLVKW